MKRERILLIIFLISFLLRIIYVIEQKKNPLFVCPITDAEYNLDLAEKIIGNPGEIPPVFFRPPLYSYFLARILKIFNNNLFAPRFFQALLNSISVILIILIGGKIFSLQAGLIAGIVASVFPPFIFFVSELLDTTLFIFLILSSAYLIILFDESLAKLYKNSSPQKFRKSYLYLIFSGLLIGIATLTRSEALSIALLLVIWIFLRIWFCVRDEIKSELNESGDKNFTFILKKSIPIFSKLILPFTLSFLIVISPATLHNIKRGGDFVLISAQGGVNLYIGNHPRSMGFSPVFPDSRYSRWDDVYNPTNFIQETGKSPGEKVKPSDISRYYFRKGMNLIFANPVQSFLLFLKKFILFFNNKEIPDNLDEYFFSREFSKIIIPLQYFSLGYILPFSFGSLFFIYRRKNQRVVPVLIFILSILITNVLFFTTGRLRLPAIPFLIILAGFGIKEIIDLILISKNKLKEAFKNNLPLWGLIFLGILIPQYPFPGSKHFLPISYFNLGFAEGEKGNLKEAEKYYLIALNLHPRYLEAKKNLGAVYLMENKLDEAEKEWRELLQIDPHCPKINESLGNLMMQKHNWDEAIKFFREEIKLNPKSEMLRYKYEEALLKGSKIEEAR